MKRVIALSLSLAMMLMLVACGGNKNNNENGSSMNEGSSLEDIIDNDNSDDILDGEEADGDNNADDSDDVDDEKQDEKTEQNATSNKNDSSGSKNDTTTTKPSTSKPAENKPADSGKTDPSANKGDTTDSKPAANKNYSGTLTDLIDGIYAKQPVDLSLESNAIDPSSDSLAYFTGLSDGSKVKEIVVSEPMMSSQAYSLVVVRVKDAADTASVAQAMFDGIDQVKWLCVTADALAVGAYGDTIVLSMVDSYNFGETLHTDLRAAYASVVGADKLDVSLERVDPDAVPKRYGAVS